MFWRGGAMFDRLAAEVRAVLPRGRDAVVTLLTAQSRKPVAGIWL